MVEFRVGDDGIPYAVEFSNVSIWPRQPDAALQSTEKKLVDPRGGHKPLGRSNTMPSTTPTAPVEKPLPSLPNEVPARTRSLRRIFPRRFSEPGRRPQLHNAWMSAAPRPREVQAESIVHNLGVDGDERVRDSVATLSLIPEVEPPEEEIAPVVEAPTRMRSLRRRPPISVLEHISSIIPEASPMLTVPPRKRRQPEAFDSDELNIRSGGLHLSFPPATTADNTPNPDPDLQLKAEASRLRRLSRAIGRAVADAGMISPNRSDGNGKASSAPGGQSLFRGTYGQVRTALRSAGLAVHRCEEEGFDGASRVGTLFVANRDVHDNVIFTKIVLYGTC
ncbi:hypothetical protein PENSPDRAFT_684987 [Peniophora sp. CONT]|nr:hypothetical protein PENSPDRAFT_684987 [Peniophora sp. CONT]